MRIPAAVPLNLPPSTPVKFEPSIAGNDPVNCAAGMLVKFAPLPVNDPEKVVAVTIPLIGSNFILLPTNISDAVVTPEIIIPSETVGAPFLLHSL